MGGGGEAQYGTVHVCNGILVNVVKIRYINLFFLNNDCSQPMIC